MSKRNLGLVSGIIVSAVIIIGVLWGLHRHQKYSSVRAIDSVPVDAGFFIRINDPNDFFYYLQNRINYRSELESFNSLASVYDIINRADTSAFINDGPGKEFLSSQVFLSYNKVGKDKIEWSAHFTVENKRQESILKSWLVRHAVNSREYTGFTIYEISAKNVLQSNLFATLQNGVLSVSGSSLLIETSIRQQQGDLSLANDENFSNLDKTTNNKSDGSLFINFSRLAEFSVPFLDHNAKNISSFLGNIAQWGAVDFEFKEDGLMLNGFLSESRESLFVSLFDDVGTKKPTISQILPSDVRLFMGYSFSNEKRFKDNLKAYSQHLENDSEIEQLGEQFKLKTGFSYMDAIFDLIDGEFALAYANYNASNPDEGHFLVLQTKGQARCMPVLEKIQQYYNVNTQPIGYYKVDDATSFPIYKGFSGKINDAVWNTLIPDVPTHFFSFYRNYLVFAESRKSLESFLYDNVLKRTLDSHAYYSSFTENFSYEENFFLFAEIPHLYPYVEGSLDPGKFHPTSLQEKVLYNFYAVGMQLSSGSGLNYATIYASHAPHRDKQPRTIWQSRIDSLVAMKPALVDNHYTNEKEILVQDEANNLYLINNMGRILWKRALNGPLLSEVFQIDYYQNNKLQYLFNTAEKIYLLDRNGNHVAKYPFTLPVEASNGLAFFDYDNNRDYRLFLALEDNRVYLFDKSGARVAGWDIPQTEGIVKQPVQFFRTSGRDYIVFSDHYRNYILDRRGNHRVIPDKSFVRNQRSAFSLEYADSENSALVTTNDSGRLVKIMLPSGRTSFFEEVDASGVDHTFELLHSNDPKYVLVSPNIMEIYSSNYKRVSSVEFSEPVLPSVVVYKFTASDHKLGIVGGNREKIFLYNSDGSLYKGFPLKGTSRFSIGFLKSSAYRFNLITGGENNYIYNYRVE
jgi:hypothetical protein